jgi:hypothetical protein
MSVPDASPAPPDRRARRRRRREVARISGATAVVAAAVSFALVDLDVDALRGLARSVAAVAAVAMLLWVAECRLARRLERLEARMERSLYWRVYSDVISDLAGGGDGETSGDISQHWPPRRPRR